MPRANRPVFHVNFATFSIFSCAAANKQKVSNFHLPTEISIFYSALQIHTDTDTETRRMNSCCWEWDNWVEEAVSKLESLKVLRSLRPIHLIRSDSFQTKSDELEFYDGLRQWDRASVEVQISEPTFQKWLEDIPSSGTTFLFLPPFTAKTVE